MLEKLTKYYLAKEDICSHFSNIFQLQRDAKWSIYLFLRQYVTTGAWGKTGISVCMKALSKTEGKGNMSTDKAM